MITDNIQTGIIHNPILKGFNPDPCIVRAGRCIILLFLLLNGCPV